MERRGPWNLILYFSLLIVALSISYYFLIFLPNNIKSKEKLNMGIKKQENVRKCYQDATEYVSAMKKSDETQGEVGLSTSLEKIHYNSMSDTCYVLTSSIIATKSFIFTTHNIWEVYTNAKVANYTETYNLSTRTTNINEGERGLFNNSWQTILLY